MKRQLPAFARGLQAKRQKGLVPPGGNCCIACDWSLGKAYSLRIVVPENEDPAQFDFRVVAGLSCLLLSRDQSRMDAVARFVIPYRPLRLIGLSLGAKRIKNYLPNELAAVLAAAQSVDEPSILNRSNQVI